MKHLPKLYVIRHAQVEINPNVPSEKWEISEEGLLSTQALVERETWPDVCRIYHSPEPKAQATAKVIADAFNLERIVQPELRELRTQLGFLSQDAFQQRVGDYLVGKSDADFENYEAAGNRIETCIKHLSQLEQGRSFAIVSHGRILTVLYSRLLGKRLGREAWQSIRLPDLSVIDLQSSTVERGFLSSYFR